jgi:hypothetical protein
MIFEKKLKEGQGRLQREKVFFFIEIGQKLMNEAREGIVNKLEIVRFCGLLRICCFTSPVPLLHHVHKWSENFIQSLLVLNIVILAVFRQDQLDRIFVKIF